MSLSLSLLAYQEALSTLSTTASFTVPLSATESTGWTSQTLRSISLDVSVTQMSLVPVSVPAATETSSPVTSAATYKRGLSHSRRQKINFAAISTFQPLNLQSSSRSSNLHLEPQPTPDLAAQTSSAEVNPSSTPSVQPSAKKSGAIMAKRPSMAFILLCRFLAFFFASPSFAASQTGLRPTPCKADPANSCLGTPYVSALMPVRSVLPGTGIPSLCADDASSSCIGSTTIGGFGAPPTAPSSLPSASASALSSSSSASKFASLTSSSSLSDLISSLPTPKTTPPLESSSSLAAPPPSAAVSKATVLLTTPRTTADHTITYTESTQSPDPTAGPISSDSSSPTQPLDDLPTQTQPRRSRARQQIHQVLLYL